jgi:hypothetical protein
MEINNKGTKMSDKIESEPPITKEPMFSITLSIYDWHKLLNELEYLQKIGNRNPDNAVYLWEYIATKLSGNEKIIKGSEKHYRLFPDDFPKPTPPKVSDVKIIKESEEPNDKNKRVCWWRRFFK